jgi:hypothetical protein
VNIIAVAGTVLLGIAASSQDPYTGTWALDVAASGGESRTQTLTIRVDGEQESYRSELVWPDGRRQITRYVAMYDGAEYPSETVLHESAEAPGLRREDTVILRKIDERTRERHWKQGGRVVRILRRVVSPDGRTLRSQVVLVGEAGEESVASTLVFVKR